MADDKEFPTLTVDKQTDRRQSVCYKPLYTVFHTVWSAAVEI